jgi:quinol monooxygenase YgiN
MSTEALNPTQTTLIVTIRISPPDIPAFLDALRPCWQACAKEPELIYFDVFHSPSEPGKFRFVEVWTKDEKWFNEHQLTKSYYGPYTEVTEPMWIQPREMEFFNRVGGWCYVNGRYLEGIQKS